MNVVTAVDVQAGRGAAMSIDAIMMYTPRPPYDLLAGCDRCHGRGWYPEAMPGTEDDYIPDSREWYCDCEAGKWRRIADGGESNFYEEESA